MIFIILLVLGLIGMIAAIWLSSASLRYVEHPVTPGTEWFAVSPERIEAAIAAAVQTRFREVLKVILKWAIRQYRETSKKITIKQEIKKRVRSFLYEHKHDGSRNPSAVWNQLKSSGDHSQDISPNEMTSSQD